MRLSLFVSLCVFAGGFTVLSTKGLSSLLAARHPLDVIKYPITYVLLAILASTAVAQITYLNRALYRFDSREVIVSFEFSHIISLSCLTDLILRISPRLFCLSLRHYSQLNSSSSPSQPSSVQRSSTGISKTSNLIGSSTSSLVV